MVNGKNLDTHLTTFSESETKSNCEDGSMLVSIITILDALKKYEVEIPKDYYESDGAYWGIANWLNDEQKKGNVEKVCENNTCDLAGKVSVDFGFAQFDSLVSEDTFVLMHIHSGQPFLKETGLHGEYPAILFKFKKGILFYDILDNITFEDISVPSMTIQNKGKHYLVLPRAVSESYFVKCLETEEAIFAYHCDKLECDIQMKLYDQEGCFDLNNQPNNPIINNPSVRKVLDSEKNISNAWIEFDRSKYEDDKNFIEIIEYLKENEI